MRYIIVVAEHRTQFLDYVQKEKTKAEYFTLERKTMNSLQIEGVAFLHVTKAYQLKGMALTENDKLIKIGSWYNLPNIEVKDIEATFRARVKK